MSSKPAKKPKAVVSKPEVKPVGKAPLAMVETRHGTQMKSRLGRGFSYGELSGAGLTPRQAWDWGVQVDVRRRSVITGNVESLKGWDSHHVSRASKAKAVEGEVEKLAEEVEKEVKATEEEVVKVAKKAKKEASKAGKTVKAKIEKPKKTKK